MKKVIPYMQKEIKNLKTRYRYNLTKELFKSKRDLLSFRNSLIEEIFELSKKKNISFYRN